MWIVVIFGYLYLAVSPVFALISFLVVCTVFLVKYFLKVNADYILHEEEKRQTSASVTSSILELKSKIKFFKIKGIETDELELILGKVKKEMARTVQSPSTALALEISANNKKAKASGVIFVAYNCYILVLIFI